MPPAEAAEVGGRWDNWRPQPACCGRPLCRGDSSSIVDGPVPIRPGPSHWRRPRHLQVSSSVPPPTPCRPPREWRGAQRGGGPEDEVVELPPNSPPHSRGGKWAREGEQVRASMASRRPAAQGQHTHTHTHTHTQTPHPHRNRSPHRPHTYAGPYRGAHALLPNPTHPPQSGHARTRARKLAHHLLAAAPHPAPGRAGWTLRRRLCC